MNYNKSLDINKDEAVVDYWLEMSHLRALLFLIYLK